MKHPVNLSKKNLITPKLDMDLLAQEFVSLSTYEAWLENQPAKNLGTEDRGSMDISDFILARTKPKNILAVQRIVNSDDSSNGNFDQQFWLLEEVVKQSGISFFVDHLWCRTNNEIFCNKVDEIATAYLAQGVLFAAISKATRDDTVLHLRHQLMKEYQPRKLSDLSQIDDRSLVSLFAADLLWGSSSAPLLVGGPLMPEETIDLLGGPSRLRSVTEAFYDDTFRQHAINSLCQAIKCVYNHRSEIWQVEFEISRRFSNKDQELIDLVLLTGPLERQVSAYKRLHSRVLSRINYFKFLPQDGGPSYVAHDVIADELNGFSKEPFDKKLTYSRRARVLTRLVQRAIKRSAKVKTKKEGFEEGFSRLVHEGLAELEESYERNRPTVVPFEQDSFSNPEKLGGPEAEILDDSEKVLCLVVEHKTNLLRIINDQQYEVCCVYLAERSEGKEPLQADIAKILGLKVHQVQYVRQVIRDKKYGLCDILIGSLQ